MAILKKISCQIILVIFLIIFFVRNLLLPIIADDYSYAFIWDGAGVGNLMDGIEANRLRRVESFSDIVESQYSHYMTWGGRTVAHIFVQFFVWQGKIFFDVANVFVMAALIFLLFKIGTGLELRQINKIYLIFILTGLYFCVPAFIITTIWLTGACNYLWMSVFEILFLLPFSLKYWRENFWIENSAGKIILMAVLGLIAGWSIEPGAVATVLVAFLFCLYFYREKNLQTWMKVGFIFLIVGFIILMFSPGNFHRMEISEQFNEMFLAKPYTAEMFLINFIAGLLPVFLREIILFVPIIFYFKKGIISPKVSKFILAFSTASILVLFVMMFSPEFPERAGFPSTIFLLIASLAALKEILPQLKKIYLQHEKNFNIAGNIFITIWILSLAGCLYVENNLNNQLAARMNFVEQHRAEDLIIVQPLEIPAWSETFLGTRTWDKMTLWWGGDLEPAIDGNRDITFAKFHGLKKIVTIERQEN